MKCLQRSLTGKLISLDGCVSFCEKFAGRGGREFDVSPNKVRFCITQGGGGEIIQWDHYIRLCILRFDHIAGEEANIISISGNVHIILLDFRKGFVNFH